MNWLKRIFSRGQLDRDLWEEIREHLEERTEALIAEGQSREDAAAAARREFGNVTLLEERGRDVWRWVMVENFLTDLRYALRQLRKSAAFTAAAVLTLALGIGANTAVFSVVNAIILRPLPYPEPDRLVSVQSRDTRGTPHPTSHSYPNFFDFRKYNRVFEQIVCYHDSDFALSGAGMPVHLNGEVVSADLFSLLKIQPALGRGFLPEEEKAGQRVVVLSHSLWNEQFSGDPDIVDRSIILDTQPYTVVGVMPAGFVFPVSRTKVKLWTTLARDVTTDTSTPMTEQRGARLLDVIARLKPGVSVEGAHAHMDTIAAALAKQYPDDDKNVASTYVRPELERLTGNTRRPLLILLGAVGLVLLIACANMANLLLARTSEREREFAIRAAIGASRGTMVRQLLTESLVLAAIGCAAGALMAIACVKLLLPLAGDSIPRLAQTAVDSNVLAFSVALALLTSLIFSIAPAVRLARTELAGPLKEGSRGSVQGADRLRSGLVVAQITLGLVLLSGAALLIASFLHLLHRDLGLQPDHVLTFSISVPGSRYPDEKQVDFCNRLLDRLRTLPGVTSVAGGTPLPLTGSQMTISFGIEERPAAVYNRPHADIAFVTPDYFRTLGIPLLEGRQFSERDDAKAPPVLIVNRAFAEMFFPGEAAVGKRLQPGASMRDGEAPMRQIVGVVGNAVQTPLELQAEPIYYIPYKQLPWFVPPIVMKTAVPPAAMESAVRSAVASIDKEVPIYDVQPMEDLLAIGIARPRFQMLLLASFAGIALLLTVVGLYGVLAYSVSKRTREIGVRVALGASRMMVQRMVLEQAMLLVAAGVVLGLAGAFAAGHVLTNMLFGVSPRNPLLLAIACCTVTLTAALAAFLPARRAASIDPMQALRNE
ncbi:MAG TPA: ABC transporter permease [Bryobacteraceae bacterium]|nr:ABC transporter permease [Bryobacteraceae bacterium]